MATDDGDDESGDISLHAHLKISTMKKQRWLKHAEEHQRNNLSAFIEESIDNTLSGAWILKDEAEVTGEVIEVDLSGLDGSEARPGSDSCRSTYWTRGVGVYLGPTYPRPDGEPMVSLV